MWLCQSQRSLSVQSYLFMNGSEGGGVTTADLLKLVKSQKFEFI